VTWETKRDGQPGWQQFFLAAGPDVNDHMLMMNRNSDQIAALVQGWMDGAGLMK
jgi:hypothetical protein